MLRTLSARVELPAVSSLLRLYAKALSGEQVAVLSSEELVDRNIGWMSESAATTEGTTIYLPPFVNSFPEQDSNFQIYKVFTTHQTGRLEFGSFSYQWGTDGQYVPATVDDRYEHLETVASDPESEESVESNATTEMQRYFDLFTDRM